MLFAIIPVSCPWARTEAMSVVAKVAEKNVVECILDQRGVGIQCVKHVKSLLYSIERFKRMTV